MLCICICIGIYMGMGLRFICISFLDLIIKYKDEYLLN